MIVRKISDETKLTRKGRHKAVQPYRESSRHNDVFIEEVRISTSSSMYGPC